ncbi:MAG: prepilin-type N-terminal cleavage/methylation domain-containing protein [Endomicrobiaceae bacterium]|nr:prepilin-type N-terminal cleavage/methylation domain-containing protein [Endomicrobiaceae bacterium]
MVNRKGFTLIEVLVSIILAGIIVYFLYILLLTSYQAYKTLSGVAKETSDIRLCETYLRKSIENACYINIEPTPLAAQATALNFGRQELYWDSATGTIKNRYIVDKYIVKDSTAPVNPGRFYLDTTNECNQIPNTRDTTKEGNYELLLRIYYTDADYNITGHTLVSEEQLLTGLKLAYYFIPSNTLGGVRRFTLLKIGLDFDDTLATGEVYRNTRLFHFAARGYGLPS